MRDEASETEEAENHELVTVRAHADYTINCAQAWIERYYTTVSPVLVSQLTRQIKALSKAMQSRSVDKINRGIQDLLEAEEVLLIGGPMPPNPNLTLPRVHRDWEEKPIESTNKHQEQTQRKLNGSVFVSYAHADSEWLYKLLTHLRPVERTGRIQLWHDRKINPGDRWRKEIASVVNSATVVVLMVSANFMASDFIYSNELPPIVQRAKARGVAVFPIILGHCLFEEDEFLGEFQTFNDPENPLSRLDASDVDKVLVNLAKAILAAC